MENNLPRDPPSGCTRSRSRPVPAVNRQPVRSCSSKVIRQGLFLPVFHCHRLAGELPALTVFFIVLYISVYVRIVIAFTPFVKTYAFSDIRGLPPA